MKKIVQKALPNEKNSLACTSEFLYTAFCTNVFMTQLPKFSKLFSIRCRIQEVRFPCVAKCYSMQQLLRATVKRKNVFQKADTVFFSCHSVLSLERISVLGRKITCKEISFRTSLSLPRRKETGK